MRSIFDCDRIRFSRFRYASDEIWSAVARSYGVLLQKTRFAQNGVPPSACSRFDAKSRSTGKIKPGQTWKVFVFIKEETAEGARTLTHAENAINRRN